MERKITVKRAAYLLGISELTVRYGIKNGELPIGSAIHCGENRTYFHIVPKKLSEYLGVSEEEIISDRKS